MTALARSTFLRRAILVGVALVPLLSGASLASAQTGGWSKPVPLSSASTTSWFPDVAADLSGKVHVVWSSGTTLGVGQSYDTVMYTSSIDGFAWPDPVDIIALPDTGNLTRPALYSDPRGLLHMTYRGYSVFYTHSPVQAVSATTLQRPQVTISADTGYFSRLSMDVNGGLHLVYTEQVPSTGCPGCRHVLYRNSNDQGKSWSDPVDVSRNPTGAAKPQIVVDDEGRLRVVWEAGLGGDIGQVTSPTSAMYTASDDGGKTWLPPVQLNTSGTEARDTTLGITGSGQMIVAWLGLPDDIVFFQTSDDHGLHWTTPQPIPGIYGGWSVYQARTDGYSMATDSAGDVHLLAVGRTAPSQSTLSVLHIAWDGMHWTAAEPLVTLAGDVPEWPRVSVGLGNHLHVVWFVRDQAHIWGGEGTFLYRVWYAQKVLTAPAINKVVWPTITADRSTPVPSDHDTPAASPASPLAPALSTPLGSIPQSEAIPPADFENQALKGILQGMVPVVILLAVVAVAAHFRHR